MQVTETNSEGLKREFKVVVPAAELDTRLEKRLNEIQGNVNIKGFRPGKVPLNHLKRLVGRNEMAQIVNTVMSEVARQTLNDRGERAATKPDYQLPEDQAEAEKILSGSADLAYTMAYEVLPEIKLGDFKSIAVERPTVAVADETVDTRVKQLAESARSFTPKDGAAEEGDRLTVSYAGKIDGEAFDGGTSDNAVVTIGDGQFIPGFAEQMVGLKAGDTKTITVTFPEDYAMSRLAGKEATFDVSVKTVAAGDAVSIDDELAKRLGVESLEKLRDTVRDQIKAQYDQASRQKVKRQLLDKLDEMHPVELPPRMVDQEFETIWRQITSELDRTGKTFADEDTTEEKARDDYRKIAERRVRLGLVMAEIGERNNIQVTEDEVQRALAAQLRQFPGQEQAIVDYYRNTPDAVAGLRAPIFEEKVVDYLLELVAVTEKPVTPEELMRDDEEENIL